MQRENLMLSDVEECNNLMLTRLTPVATLFAIAIEIKKCTCSPRGDSDPSAVVSGATPSVFPLDLVFFSFHLVF